jgi:nitric oxide reductase large subunit
MRYRSQSVAYWYFAVAMVLFGLQLVFGLLSAAKYLGPDSAAVHPSVRRDEGRSIPIC